MGGIRKVLIALDPKAFEDALLSRGPNRCCAVQSRAGFRHQKLSLSMARRLVAAYDGLEKAVHLLSLVAHKSGLTLAQTQVPNGGENKTNEHKTALQLLRGIVLEGRLVTGDAMFCQRDLSRQIIDGHGHYLWFVKDNQPTLLNDIRAAFAASVVAAFSP